MQFIGKLSLIAALVTAVILCYYFLSWLSAKRGKAFRKPYHQLYRGQLWLLLFVGLASLILFIAFVVQDFTFLYVASHSSEEMTLLQRLSAFWAGQEGSLLLWLLILSGYTTYIGLRRVRAVDHITSYALLVMDLVQLFFLSVLVFVSDPFKIAPVGSVGQGINPLLLHWAMILHPPTLFIGYAGLTIPFAFAVGTLLARDSSAKWVEKSHELTIFSWLFLTIGIFLGALWAYVVLGWGGYWGWDPVENASFVPWLTGTALLHSLTAYRRKGVLKFWTLSLAIITFILVIISTFITRSGLIQSVHAFAANIALTAFFGLFVAATVITSIYLIVSRRADFQAEEPFSSFASKQFTYYLNNVALVIFAFILFTATVIPPFFGRNLGPEFYNRLAQPLGLLYLALVALCPMFSWSTTDIKKFLIRSAYPTFSALAAAIPLYICWKESYLGFIGLVLCVFSAVAVGQLFVVGAIRRSQTTGKNVIVSFFSLFKYSRSQAGGYLTHFGIVIIMAGLIGSTIYVLDLPKAIPQRAGETIKVSNYQLVFKHLNSNVMETKEIYSAVFAMYDGKGSKINEIAPRIVFYKRQQQSTREAAIHYEPFRDIFVIFQGIDKDGKISLDIKVNPLVSFIWLGSIIMILGTCLAVWPRKVPNMR
jgi:cytochrome c-type biogenesis protein CcmF